jgi:hypothetical protein
VIFCANIYLDFRVADGQQECTRSCADRISCAATRSHTGACADAPHMSQPREAAADSLPSADLAVDPSGADSVEPPDGGFPASGGGSSAAFGSPAPTRRTQAQHGISKPKNYTYGTIRYAFTSVTGEPETLGEAFEDGNW